MGSRPSWTRVLLSIVPLTHIEQCWVLNINDLNQVSREDNECNSSLTWTTYHGPFHSIPSLVRRQTMCLCSGLYEGHSLFCMQIGTDQSGAYSINTVRVPEKRPEIKLPDRKYLHHYWPSRRLNSCIRITKTSQPLTFTLTVNCWTSVKSDLSNNHSAVTDDLHYVSTCGQRQGYETQRKTFRHIWKSLEKFECQRLHWDRNKTHFLAGRYQGVLRGCEAHGVSTPVLSEAGLTEIWIQ